MQRPTEEIPAEWLTLLEGAASVNSFVEAAIEVLKLEVGLYRDQLMLVDRQVRMCREAPEAAKWAACLSDLQTANSAWLVKQGEATRHLQARKGSVTSLAELALGLETILLEQRAQIERSGNNIERLDLQSDVAAGCGGLIGELGPLLDVCHALRDRMQESLAVVLAQEGRLDTLERQLQIDAATGLKNRCALARLMADWEREDPSHKRLVSVALADIDGLGELNRAHGPQIGDRVVAAVGRLLEEGLRKDRGFDVGCRYAGGRFLAFLADTGPRNATSALERFRQTVESCEFIYDGVRIPVHISCGVVEVQANDSPAITFARAEAALQGAKSGGRNATNLDEGAGPEAVQPPQYRVKSRRVELDRLEESLAG